MLKSKRGRLYKEFKRIDGSQFNAVLTQQLPASGNLITNYRILHVANPSVINVGNVIRLFGNELGLLLSHPNHSNDTESYKVSTVARVEVWKRITKVKDFVSGVYKNSVEIDLGPLYITFDMPSDVPVGVVSDTRYRFLCGQDVMVGDKIGTKTIKTLHDILGVKLGYAE